MAKRIWMYWPDEKAGQFKENVEKGFMACGLPKDREVGDLDECMRKKGGLDAEVLQNGRNFSGGQKQRLTIARALVRKPEILILDDSLSAVDTDTEEKIIDNLKRVRNGKTNIIIAHRISTVRNADHIMILEGGKVAEYGTHDELIALGGSYARLYEKQQLEKMIEEAV